MNCECCDQKRPALTANDEGISSSVPSTAGKSRAHPGMSLNGFNSLFFTNKLYLRSIAALTWKIQTRPYKIWSFMRNFFKFSDGKVSPNATKSQSMLVGKCVVCLCDESEFVFIDCGHLCVCKICAKKFSPLPTSPDDSQSMENWQHACPKCRVKIQAAPILVFQGKFSLYQCSNFKFCSLYGFVFYR